MLLRFRVKTYFNSKIILIERSHLSEFEEIAAYKLIKIDPAAGLEN